MVDGVMEVMGEIGPADPSKILLDKDPLGIFPDQVA